MRDTRRTRVLLGAALLAGLAMLAAGYSGSPVTGAARSMAGTALGTAERVVSLLSRPISGFLRWGMAGAASGGQVAGLERQLTRMRSELSAASAALGRYQQLVPLRRVSMTGGYRVLPAQVIAFGQAYQQTVTLDVGSVNGVRPLQTVLDGDGLVGQVTAVNPQTCTVLLASDPSSVVGVRLAPSGQVGWVTGLGRDTGRGPGGLLRLQVLNPAAVLTAGERLVTAASMRDRPFVPGVPVGVITLVRGGQGALTVQALVRPFADMTALDVVGVVIGPPRADPGFTVLRPAAGTGK